jgi:hypothetical protein
MPSAVDGQKKNPLYFWVMGRIIGKIAADYPEPYEEASSSVAMPGSRTVSTRGSKQKKITHTWDYSEAWSSLSGVEIVQ